MIIMGRVGYASKVLLGWAKGLARPSVYYIADRQGWVADGEAGNICRAVGECSLLRPRVVQSVDSLRRQVVHFGYLYLFTEGGYARAHRSNKVVVTCYHGDRADPAFMDMMDVFVREEPRVDKVIVSCQIMLSRLREWGFPESKVVLIPIGVDLAVFRPPTPVQRAESRARLGLAGGSCVIGSFQKDGVGWAEGLEPKLVKGPDVFLEVMGSLSRELPLTVLLTGPARGYVKQGLERLRIPYRHVLCRTAADVAACYHALDLYLVTSREEGGPKAVMESMATGVPLVSTRVGMAADWIRDAENGFVCDVGDVAVLTQRAREVLGNPVLGAALAVKGRETVTCCDYAVVARRHVAEVYAPLLDTLRIVNYWRYRRILRPYTRESQ